MSYILGWKDILRPIRDGYRHLFPSPDTGPTPEERERQRSLDRLKGFTYLDTFAQLEAWTRADSDPVQRANTPLLPRPQLSGESEKRKAAVLLCHDYSGNYHDYEAAHGIGVEEESYTCEYLQFVDYFVYFSHKLVCVPPPTWTNTLHRNGVKALGTLLVEPQTKDAEKLIQQVSDKSYTHEGVVFPLAKTLAAIARHYGFDGWLVNIEKPFIRESWDPRSLVTFLEQLRADLGPDGILVWYDALTTDNKVAYQNALTVKNASFTQACGSLLTNYCWKEEDALGSKHLALHANLNPCDVFFGVDVWAQNKSTLTHPRVTYPEKGGGGTCTGIAVNKLSDIGLSVGVFAPAWSFEHFPNHGREVEQAIWNGRSLPTGVSCSCNDTGARHPSNREFPVTRAATQFPAGSDIFFHTDFSRGFVCHSEPEADRLYDGKTMHSQLASQSILPHTSATGVEDNQIGDNVNIISHRLDDVVGRTQLVVEAYSAAPASDTTTDTFECWLPLFIVNMIADGTLQFRITYECLLQMPNARVRIYLRYDNERQFIPEGSCEEDTQFVIADPAIRNRSETDSPRRLREIGVYLQAPCVGNAITPILEIHEIRIAPRATPTLDHIRLDNVRLIRRGEHETAHWRLCWSYYDSDRSEPALNDSLHSEITGPFSHFMVHFDGLDIGKAYALEHVLPGKLMKQLIGKEVKVLITGIGFGGTHLARAAQVLRVPAENKP